MPARRYIVSPQGGGTPPPSNMPAAPLIAAFYTGGSFKYNGATIQGVMKHCDAFMYNFPAVQQASQGVTAASFCQTAVAGALSPTPINDGDPVTTIWSNGIRRKRYQMANGRIAWFLVNPPGNGAQNNVALGQRMQTLSGTQNPTVNTGNNNVTTISMPDSSGRILVTYP